MSQMTQMSQISCMGVCGCARMCAHIWFESNLVNFEFPEGLNAVLGSSQPPYLKIGVEFSLTKNVPFSKISVKI